MASKLHAPQNAGDPIDHDTIPAHERLAILDALLGGGDSLGLGVV